MRDFLIALKAFAGLVLGWLLFTAGLTLFILVAKIEGLENESPGDIALVVFLEFGWFGGLVGLILAIWLMRRRRRTPHGAQQA